MAKSSGSFKPKEFHPLWKGDKAKYLTKHIWLYRNFGKANECENKECPKTCLKYEWSNISGKYLRKRSDYRMLCISCHRRNDYFIRHGNHCIRGHEFTIENTYFYPITKKRKCRTCINQYFRERRKNAKRKNSNSRN